MAPLCQQLSLPFRWALPDALKCVVRIRSTCLEQQLYESLMMELDANLLLPLALGHSCIVWDCGARNRNNGCPRAIWYGLEFIRFALHRFWLGSGGMAHLRGHDVSRIFEQACRSFAQTTKKRLRYYKRFVTPSVQHSGIQLAGIFQRTDRDEDVDFFTQQAWQHCGPACNSSSRNSSGGASSQDVPAAATDDAVPPIAHQHPAVSQQDLDAYRVLLAAGCGVFSGGLSHTQFRGLQAAGLLGGGGDELLE